MSPDSLDIGEGDGEVAVKAEDGAALEEIGTSTPTSTQLLLEPRTNTVKQEREEEEPLAIQGLNRSTAERTKTLKQKREEEESLLIQGLCRSLTERNDESKRLKLFGECAGYAAYMCECLDKLDPRTRYIAQYQINNVLFQAQMGLLVHKD